ncbi:MAG TPA: acetyl-CoA carboxylase biotin carboxyl carrier protein subunit [Polyangiaceae bacterium]
MTDSMYVTVGSEQRGVATETLASRAQLVRIDGREATLEARVLAGTPAATLSVDGRVVVLLPLGEGCFYDARSRRVVRVERGSVRREAGAASTGSSAGALRAPMPGRIVRVLVNEGDSVAAGAAIVVIEAMKMENELLAQRAGVVRRVSVKSGDTVDRDALLVELE